MLYVKRGKLIQWNLPHIGYKVSIEITPVTLQRAAGYTWRRRIPEPLLQIFLHGQASRFHESTGIRFAQQLRQSPLCQGLCALHSFGVIALFPSPGAHTVVDLDGPRVPPDFRTLSTCSARHGLPAMRGVLCNCQTPWAKRDSTKATANAYPPCWTGIFDGATPPGYCSCHLV